MLYAHGGPHAGRQIHLPDVGKFKLFDFILSMSRLLYSCNSDCNRCLSAVQAVCVVESDGKMSNCNHCVVQAYGETAETVSMVYHLWCQLGILCTGPNSNYVSKWSMGAVVHQNGWICKAVFRTRNMRVPRDVSILALLGFAPCIAAFLRIDDARTWWSIFVSASVSFAGFEVTKRVIPLLKRYTLNRGLHGKDINKRGTEAGEKPIPESLGLAPGIVFLVCIILFQQLHYYDAASVLHRLWSGGSHKIFAKQPITEAWLVDYNAALATI